MAWMAAWGEAVMEAALDAATPLCGYVSGWGLDGDDVVEVTSREAVTWGAASAYMVSASNQPVLDVAGACEIIIIALMSAASGGTIDDASATLEPEEPPIVEFTEAGTYTLTSIVLGINM